MIGTLPTEDQTADKPRRRARPILISDPRTMPDS